MATALEWDQAMVEKRAAGVALKEAATREATAKGRCIYALIRFFSPVPNGNGKE